MKIKLFQKFKKTQKLYLFFHFQSLIQVKLTAGKKLKNILVQMIVK